MAMTATRKAACPRCGGVIQQGAAIEAFMQGERRLWACATSACRNADASDVASTFPGEQSPRMPKTEAASQAAPPAGPVVSLPAIAASIREEAMKLGKILGTALDEGLGEIRESTRQMMDSQERLLRVESDRREAKLASDTRRLEETLSSSIDTWDLSFREEMTRMEKGLTALAESVRKSVIEVRTPTVTYTLPEGVVRHEVFPRVFRLAAAGMDCLVHGPAGTGKTHLCKQVAEALPCQDGSIGRRFGFITGSPGVTERHFAGTTTPNIQTGEAVFTGTEFIECFEKGGVFLIDEGDNMDPSVWVSLNAALANGRMPLPLRKDAPFAARHPDFILIVSANTTGGGADRMYSARAKLDASTVDRFAGCMVPMGYSDAVEATVCPDPDLLTMLRGWRQRIADSRLERILSTRFVARAYLFRKMGDTITQIAAALTRDAGWSRDEATLVIGQEIAKSVYGDA